MSSEMIGAAGGIDTEVLRRIHASAITDQAVIIGLLRAAREAGLALIGRRTVRGDAETARIAVIEDDDLLVECENIEVQPGAPLFLTFAIEGKSYFLTATAGDQRDGLMRLQIPSVLYVSDRRDRPRIPRGGDRDAPSQVILAGIDRPSPIRANVEDFSPIGLSIEAAELEDAGIGAVLRLEYADGALQGTKVWAKIRRIGRSPKTGWTRLGVSTSEVQFNPPLEVERRVRLGGRTRLARVRNKLELISGTLSTASSRIIGRVRDPKATPPSINLVRYSNGHGGWLTGIVDRHGASTGGTAVVIPPAWGRTKETLLPLAATIVETFRKARVPVTVLRFDGSCRRGESYKEPGFEEPGREHIPFRFTHAIGDIIASARYVARDAAIRASRVILVTFSAASIEGRRALATDEDSILSGWVSVVGTPDLQSGMRTVSGGIDYVAGVEQGLHFGVQEIMGVPTDVDALMRNALDLELAYLEDARRDMSKLTLPITWIHGANDAWLDLERVREVMSAGSIAQRSLIEVPTGHQLRTSREALEVFMLVAEECARMALGRDIRGCPPSLPELERKRDAERSRVREQAEDIRELWRRYLLGRAHVLGIELMNATRAYEQLMAMQIAALGLVDGARVADVGCGTGPFLLALSKSSPRPMGLVVDAIDFVPEAFERAKRRLAGADLSGLEIRFTECDLDDPAERRLVLRDKGYDAVLLSLVLSYVSDPRGLLRDLAGAMKPGARIVASTLRRDADVSRIYLESVDELRRGRAREVLGAEAELVLDSSVRAFLNDMARVLDLEERGVFQFLDEQEVGELLVEAGFVDVRSERAFGDPPQAVILMAHAPK